MGNANHSRNLAASAIAINGSRHWSPLLHQLLSSPQENLGHAKMQLISQPFNLLVERVGQLDFGTFHAYEFTAKQPIRASAER